jgi:hypothetical protein
MSRGDLILRVAAALAVLACLAELVLPALFANKSLHLATSVQNERITELYFVDHTSLPKTVPVDKPTQVSFHIQNEQGTDEIYYPRVTVFVDGVAHQLPQRALAVADGQGKDVPVTFQPATPGQNLEIVIDLPAQGESIHFRSQS